VDDDEEEEAGIPEMKIERIGILRNKLNCFVIL
jgi:hypothetical protein